MVFMLTTESGVKVLKRADDMATAIKLTESWVESPIISVERARNLEAIVTQISNITSPGEPTTYEDRFNYLLDIISSTQKQKPTFTVDDLIERIMVKSADGAGYLYLK